MCYVFETFKPALAAATARTASRAKPMPIVLYTFSERSFLSLFFMNLMWYAGIPASPNGSSTNLNVAGFAQTTPLQQISYQG